jgi:hypothetical protein
MAAERHRICLKLYAARVRCLIFHIAIRITKLFLLLSFQDQRSRRNKERKKVKKKMNKKKLLLQELSLPWLTPTLQNSVLIIFPLGRQRKCGNSIETKKFHGSVQKPKGGLYW